MDQSPQFITEMGTKGAWIGPDKTNDHPAKSFRSDTTNIINSNYPDNITLELFNYT